MTLLPHEHPRVHSFPWIADEKARLAARPGKWRTLAAALVKAGVAETALPMLVAHVALEHGRDLEALFNFCVGNVKLWAGARPDTPWFRLTDNFKSTDRYKHHDTLDAGVRPYVYEICGKPERATVYAAARRGHVLPFADGLLETEYIGDDPRTSYAAQLADVRACMKSLYNEALSTLWPMPPKVVA